MRCSSFLIIWQEPIRAVEQKLLELQSEVFKLRIDLLLGPICRLENILAHEGKFANPPWQKAYEKATGYSLQI